MPRIYLSNDVSDVTGYKQAYVDMKSPITTALSNSATTTTASGTSIQATATAGGTALKWITAPLGAATTLATIGFVNIWAKETNASGNCTVSIQLFPYSAAVEGSVCLTDTAYTVELTTSYVAQRYATAAVTSQAFAVGDRLVIKIFIINVGTMGALTGGALVDYDAPTEGVDGDTYIDIQEPFRVNKQQFGAGTAPHDPAVSTGYCTNMINVLNEGIAHGYYPMNAQIRAAIDSVTYERNLLSPVTKQVIPT
jgi:hypothetical protein